MIRPVMLQICLLLCCLLGIQSQAIDYYWRDYYGEVPKDALPVIKDLNAKDVFVVQAFIDTYGIFFGELRPGYPIEIACDGVKTPQKLMKILCSRHRDNFDWMLTSHTTYDVDMINRYPVIGGFNHYKAANGFLNVGRTTYQGIMKVCEIVSWGAQKNCWFAYEGKPIAVENYEALVYNVNQTIPKCEETQIITH